MGFELFDKKHARDDFSEVIFGLLIGFAIAFGAMGWHLRTYGFPKMMQDSGCPYKHPECGENGMICHKCLQDDAW